MKLLVLALWTGLALAQGDRFDALQKGAEALQGEKARLAQFRASDPQRYAKEMRALLDRRAAQVRTVEDMPNVAIPARMSLASEYNALAGFLRFNLLQPDGAIDAYEAAHRMQPADSLDIASLGIADIARFDQGDKATAIERYKRTLFSVSGKWSGPNAELAAGFKRWLGAEIAYLEGGKRWSGTLGKPDLMVAQLWLVLTSRQQPLPAGRDSEILASLTPSQLQIGRLYPAILLFPPDEMLSLFAKHDPSGYLTGAILALSLTQDPSPYVKSAAERFFNSRGITPPSGKIGGI
jgi:tetratricopeptide (TPR) repeat protein